MWHSFVWIFGERTACIHFTQRVRRCQALWLRPDALLAHPERSVIGPAPSQSRECAVCAAFTCATVKTQASVGLTETVIDRLGKTSNNLERRDPISVLTMASLQLNASLPEVGFLWLRPSKRCFFWAMLSFFWWYCALVAGTGGHELRCPRIAFFGDTSCGT